MALSIPELKDLIADLQRRYRELSREYSEIHGKNRQAEILKAMKSIDDQISLLQEQWMNLLDARSRAADV